MYPRRVVHCAVALLLFAPLYALAVIMNQKSEILRAEKL
jgi:hypothetical protein